MMRKTGLFIFIAVLLSTLLMTVACDSTPVSVPNSLNDRVFASIKFSNKPQDNSRSLTISNIDIDDCYYEYVMIPMFDYPAGNEKIYGQVGSIDENGNVSGWKRISNTGELGFVTMGRWSVAVRAMKNINGENVEHYRGFSEAYFNTVSSSVDVLLLPFGDNNSLSISLNKLVLSETNSEYYYSYEIEGKTGLVSSGLLLQDQNDSNQCVTTIDNLNAGSYIVKVFLYKSTSADNSEEPIASGEKIGGIVRTVDLCGSNTVSIDGFVQPSDFVETSVDIELVNVDVSLSVEQDETDSRICHFVLSDNTIAPNGYSVTYKWYVNSNEIENTNSNQRVFDYNFLKYGRKNVSCIAVYTKNDGNTYSAQGRANVEFSVNP